MVVVEGVGGLSGGGGGGGNRDSRELEKAGIILLIGKPEELKQFRPYCFHVYLTIKIPFIYYKKKVS